MNIAPASNLLLYCMDSYKAGGHAKMLPFGTSKNVAYLEARTDEDVQFFGLQYILKNWLTRQITYHMVDEMDVYLREHFVTNPDLFNRAQWEYIVDKHDGRLPLHIRALPEGMVIPGRNVLLTIENTDPQCAWLTTALEDLFIQTWYPTTVATLSREIINHLKLAFNMTSDLPRAEEWWRLYLHDFGQRGVSSMESAGIGGMAHLVNSRGSDTLMAVPYARKYYAADPTGLALSVAASEHSVMCPYGRERQYERIYEIMEAVPEGVLSVVSDTYDIEEAVKAYCTDLKEAILARNGKFVIRPDSPRFKGDTAAAQIVWIAEALWNGFGGRVNGKGYRVLHDNVGIIYGDGLEKQDIHDAIRALIQAGFSAETCVYGMGGGLLQKINRDTLGFAMKTCAHYRNGVWHDINKAPKDGGKASKKGRLKLVKTEHGIETVKIHNPGDDLLRDVYKEGRMLVDDDFNTVRKRAGVTV